MRRRRVIAAVLGGSVASMAGCIGGDDEEDDPLDEPVGAASAYVSALNARNYDRMEELIHPDSPRPTVTEEDREYLEEYDVEMAVVEVIEERNDEARISVQETRIDPGTDEEETVFTEIEARWYESEWQVWRPELE